VRKEVEEVKELKEVKGENLTLSDTADSAAWVIEL
jgi:hypothetical protein